MSQKSLGPMPAVTIKLFLQAGEPQRLRIGEIPNWSGKATAALRSELDTFLKQEELEGPGVYVLVAAAKDTGLAAAQCDWTTRTRYGACVTVQ